MSAKKILSYGRFFLILLLALYLILVWMYFKDNAQQLTSFGLLVWFVVIPLVLLGSILALLWWQKKQEKNTKDVSDDTAGISSKDDDTKAPETYQLFMYSRVCLPEGDSWSEVIDNNEDLTVLSEDLVDIDGLPLLIKPIARLTDAASLPYVYVANSDFDSSHADSDYDDEALEEEANYTERMVAQNSTTLRLHSLVHELLVLSDDLLATLAEHFQQHHDQDNTHSNSAIHVHPDWQQHYLVSANEESEVNTVSESSHPSLSELSIYLCLPASADPAFLSAVVKEQLMDYLIPETVISITSIVTDDNEVVGDIEGGTLHCDLTEFINEHIVALSQSDAPDLRLLLIADSQINEDWLDSNLVTNHHTNVIPTEAGTLLVFFNKATQDVLDIDDKASVLLTEFGTPLDRNDDSKRRRYLNHLTTIKNLLIKSNLSLSQASSVEQEVTKKPTTKQIQTNSKTNVALEDMTITAISDINPSIQTYDISVYMSFLEAFIAHDALVNEHHLGHYMPLNNWLKSFISLALFVDLAKENQQESERSFLITQHKQCTMLWLADVSSSFDS